MNNFLNTMTNNMNLQFGSDKCEKVHIGKKLNKDVCPTLSVDCLKEVVEENGDGKQTLKDIYDGKKIMKEVTEKKYLGDIISNDGKNDKNIKDRTNKALGNINKNSFNINRTPIWKIFFSGNIES